jgi:exopolysaccharide biosynthesis polyprenyl glycosylphosphotransferase
LTIEQQEAMPKTTNRPADGVLSPVLPERDVRRKRPPVLSFVLRLETLRRITRVLSLLALDFVGVVGGLFTALMVKLALGDSFNATLGWSETRRWIAFAYLVTVLMFARADLYADRPRRPGFSAIATALFQATVIALVFALANGEHFNSYFVFYGSLFFGVVYITSLRYLHTRVTGLLLEKAGYRRRALLVGSGKHIEAVAHALAGRSHTPVDLVGYISLKPRPQNGLRSLGQLGELPEVLARERVQEVIIADPDFPHEKAVELVDQCHQRGVSVHIAPSTMEILFKRAEFVPGESVPLFTLRPPVFEGIDYAVKRTFDLVLSSALLVLLSPVLVAIAAAIKLSSRGPVIYRSSRPGMAGRPFRCFKFRTMRVHADQVQADLEPLNEASGALFKIRHDPRLTRVGRLLRRFSLDELPQLVNVIRGEMSLVGPRPLPTRDFERLEEWHKKRYLVLPGITGLWQISGRSELDFDDLVRLDFLYLERWSVFLDLAIMLKTIPAVLSRRGAF